MHARWAFAAGCTQNSVISMCLSIWCSPILFSPHSGKTPQLETYARSHLAPRSHPDMLRGRDAIGSLWRPGAVNPPTRGPPPFCARTITVPGRRQNILAQDVMDLTSHLLPPRRCHQYPCHHRPLLCLHGWRYTRLPFRERFDHKFVDRRNISRSERGSVSYPAGFLRCCVHPVSTLGRS